MRHLVNLFYFILNKFFSKFCLDNNESSIQINDIDNQILSSENQRQLSSEKIILDEDKKYKLTTCSFTYIKYIFNMSNFLGFFLGCTYSSTIGSIGSLMKTPSNIMLKGYINKYHLKSTLNFTNFTLFSIPLSIILVVVIWWFLSLYWIPKE